MKIFNKSLLVIAAFLLSTHLVSADTRIGYVDFARLMEQAPQVKVAQSKMENEFSPREKELVSLQRSLKEMEDQLARDGAVMGESERAKLERGILTSKRELKRAGEEFREDLTLRRNDVLSRLQKNLYETVVDFAEGNKFDLIVGDGVFYASKQINITDQVLKALEKDFKVRK
ncbi:MAG: OmpH family outer membrane protein [Gammaproteobacteria bacterium]|nr:OmpH family outer membrane protein [Gammaproteobacteria bacterium]